MSPVAKNTSSSRKSNLTEADFVDAAVRLAEEHGLSKLTMRLLADDLGVSPMALYHHLSDKADLLVLIVDTVLAAVEVPAQSFGSWQERLTELQRRNRAASEPYPGVDLVISQVQVTEEGERLMRGYLRILQDGGFSEREAMLGLATIHSFGYGAALVRRQIGQASWSGGSGRPRNEIAKEWARLLVEESGRESAERFRQRVILGGLEALKGSLA